MTVRTAPENVRTKRRLAATVSARIIAVAVLAILLVGGVSLYRDYTVLEEALTRDLAAFEAEKRQMLENRARHAEGYIEYERSRFDERLRAELKDQVAFAHGVAGQLIRRFGSSGTDVAADIVREALRPLRWRQGRAYFFAVDLDGVSQLNSADPTLEGRNLLTEGSPEQAAVVSKLLDLLKDREEGFIEWRWPNPAANGQVQRKLGFVKLLKPLGWIIGTGEYLPDAEADLKSHILDRLAAMKFSDGGYVFVGRWDGISIGRIPKSVQGKNMWDVEDANGLKIVQELISLAKSGGGLLEYVMPDFGETKPFRKLSYVVGVPDWQWYLGAGTSLRDIEEVLASERDQGWAAIYQWAGVYGAFLLLVIGVFVVLSRRAAAGVESDYRRFAAFFREAATGDRRIAAEEFEIAEFEELAYAANRMVDERVAIGEQLRESEELYRTAFRTSPDAINLNRLDDGLYVDINEGFTELTGFTREDSIGKTSAEIQIWVDPDDRRRLVEGLRQHGQVTNLETRFRRKDGSEAPALMSARVLNIKGVPQILSVSRDISQLKQAEEALRASEENYRLLIENQTDLIVKVDPEGRFLYVSPSYCACFDKTEDELLGQTFMPLVHEDDREPTAKAMEALYSPPHVAYIEQRARTAKGWRWLAWQDTAVLDGEGNVREIIGVGRDIHDRKLADQALAESEGKFRRAIENMPLIGVSLDKEGRIIFVNDHFAGLTGWAADELIGRDWFSTFLPVGEAAEIKELVTRAMATGDLGEDVRHENEILTRSGDRLLVSWFNVLTKSAGGETTGMTGMGLDVTERTRVQRTLEEERRFIGTVLDTLSDGVVVCNADGEVTLVNRALREFHGYDGDDAVDRFRDADARAELLQADGCTPLSGADLPLFRALKGTPIRGTEMVIAPKNGPRRVISVNAEPMLGAVGSPAGAVAVMRDITEQKRTEEQLRHAQKMEAVGHLTGGVAHDFNNLLQVILSNLHIAQDRMAGNEEVTKWLDGARRAGWRGAELTQKLLSFSRKQTLHPEVVDPNELISGMLDLLRRTLGEDIEISTGLDENVPAILIDPGGLENAVLNLAVNARAAMPNGGTLTIESRGKRLDTEIAIENDQLPAGDYVEIAVTDTGCGMVPEVLERAFEPFFTTKDVGEGSGLGLSMVYGFARQSEGNVTITSQPDFGTTVTFLLPAAGAPDDDSDGAADSFQARADGMSGTILVVEDDPDVRASAVILLELLGFAALEAENGEAALKILEGDADIDLLFSDVVMPRGVSGIELAREARRLRRGLKVILVSGYPEAELRKSSGLGEDEFRLLMKPYTHDELVVAINEAMGR